MRVSQVVGPDARQFGCCKRTQQRASNLIWRQVSPYFVGEYQITHLPHRRLLPHFGLPQTVRMQDVDRLRVNRNGPPTSICFHVANNVSPTGQPLELLLKRNAAALQVDVAPAESKQFAHAQSRRKLDEKGCSGSRSFQMLHQRLLEIQPRLSRRCHVVPGCLRVTDNVLTNRCELRSFCFQWHVSRSVE